MSLEVIFFIIVFLVILNAIRKSMGFKSGSDGEGAFFLFSNDDSNDTGSDTGGGGDGGGD